LIDIQFFSSYSLNCIGIQLINTGDYRMSILRKPSVLFRAGLSRRDFIGLMIFSGLINFLPKSVFAAIGETALEQRCLSLYNPRTKESYDGAYWYRGDYIGGAVEKINQLMRDVRTGEINQIDTHLLDLISEISIKINSEKPFHVISGYRSPKTNALLRSSGKGAAKNSYHLRGQAVDIRLPGHRASVLRREACELKKGGVGYYPRRGFVHIDVGPIRYWKG
jgi:uncharacterized protein YcbK (DUF882 family)